MILLRSSRLHMRHRTLLDVVSESGIFEGEDDRVEFEVEGDLVSMQSHVSRDVGEGELVESGVFGLRAGKIPVWSSHEVDDCDGVDQLRSACREEVMLTLSGLLQRHNWDDLRSTAARTDAVSPRVSIDRSEQN